MIRFTKIRWKNLLSTGNAFTEIDLTAARTTLILGENGSGKSTLLDALCFALFGRPYRDVNKPQLLNSVNGKKCEVEVEFEVGKKTYKIVRGIKPAIFEIYVDGELVNQDAASRDYQKYLEESVLKMNFKSFTQIVILGSAGFVPFMQLPSKERRTIIEDILDIQIFTIMNILLKQKVKETSDAHLQLTRDLELAKQKALVQDKYIKNLLNDKAADLAKHTEELITQQKLVAKLEDEYNAAELELEKLQTSKDEYDGWEAKFSQEDTVYSIEKEIKRLNMQLEDRKKNDSCGVCMQPISAKVKAKNIAEKEAEIAEQQAMMDKVRAKLAKITKRMEELEPRLDLYDKQAKKVSELSYQLRTAQALEIAYAKRVADSMKEKGNIEEEKAKLKELAKDLMQVNKKRSEATEEKFYLELAGGLLKDSGIKTKIMEQYLPVINKMVNKYLSEMDFYVQFTLDNELKEVIKSRFRDEFTYASFSEGEKQRIDLALLFTWRTIAKMKNSAATNLLILDEVFDSSLDASATEYVMNLINTLSADSHVFVISHKPEALADKFARVLRFEKRQNFSVLTEES